MSGHIVDFLCCTSQIKPLLKRIFLAATAGKACSNFVGQSDAFFELRSSEQRVLNYTILKPRQNSHFLTPKVVGGARTTRLLLCIYVSFNDVLCTSISHLTQRKRNGSAYADQENHPEQPMQNSAPFCLQLSQLALCTMHRQTVIRKNC